MPGTIDHGSYPDIFDSIVDFMDWNALPSLCPTSKATDSRIQSILLRHVVFLLKSGKSWDVAGVTIVDPYFHRRIPGLEFPLDDEAAQHRTLSRVAEHALFVDVIGDQCKNSSIVVDGLRAHLTSSTIVRTHLNPDPGAFCAPYNMAALINNRRVDEIFDNIINFMDWDALPSLRRTSQAINKRILLIMYRHVVIHLQADSSGELAAVRIVDPYYHQPIPGLDFPLNAPATQEKTLAKITDTAVFVDIVGDESEDSENVITAVRTNLPESTIVRTYINPKPNDPHRHDISGSLWITLAAFAFYKKFTVLVMDDSARRYARRGFYYALSQAVKMCNDLGEETVVQLLDFGECSKARSWEDRHIVGLKTKPGQPLPPPLSWTKLARRPLAPRAQLEDQDA
ncbi:hypothetical protein Q8F55_009229 [Vanrija albida]|uniref:F-box domain-containing protein n=1 Tax=Vanrija albida TaxID=181172 RepID=A0ABR3PT87_9TREE